MNIWNIQLLLFHQIQYFANFHIISNSHDDGHKPSMMNATKYTKINLILHAQNQSSQLVRHS